MESFRKIENLSGVKHNHDFSEEAVESLVNDENLENEDEEDENSDSYLWQQIDQELSPAKTSVGDNLFKLAAPPAFEHDRESLISQALKGKSAEFRSEVINNAYRYGCFVDTRPLTPK